MISKVTQSETTHFHCQFNPPLISKSFKFQNNRGAVEKQLIHLFIHSFNNLHHHPSTSPKNNLSSATTSQCHWHWPWTILPCHNSFHCYLLSTAVISFQFVDHFLLNRAPFGFQFHGTFSALRLWVYVYRNESPLVNLSTAFHHLTESVILLSIENTWYYRLILICTI